MLPGSTPDGVLYSLSPQKAGGNDIVFEKLAIAAKQGTVASVVAALNAVEENTTGPIENSHLIQYIANLQNNNQIFTAIICWLALLAKSIVEAKHGLGTLKQGVDNSTRSNLERDLADYRDDLQKFPEAIAVNEAKVARLDAENAQQIQQLQPKFDLIDNQMNTTCTAEEILNYEIIIDRENCLETIEKDIENHATLGDYDVRMLPGRVQTLHSEITGTEIKVADINDSRNFIPTMRDCLQRQKAGKEALLALVKQRNDLFEQLEKLRNVDDKVELNRLKHGQAKTQAEITKIEQTLNKHKIVSELEPVIKRGNAADEEFIKNSLSAVRMVNPYLLDIETALGGMTSHRFFEIRKANSSENFSNEGTLQKSEITEDIIYRAMRLFLSPQSTRELMQQPLNRDYLKNLEGAYTNYTSARQESEIISLKIQNAWEAIKKSIEHLNQCSAENSLYRFLSPNSSPGYASISYIKDIMWDSTRANNDKIQLLQQEERKGCIVAKIYLAQREQPLNFQQLTAQGQRLQSENPDEAFSCFMAVLENNEAAAYPLASILEAHTAHNPQFAIPIANSPVTALGNNDAAPYPLARIFDRSSALHPRTISSSETGTYLLAQAILARRKNNSAAAQYFAQRARVHGSPYATVFLRLQQTNMSSLITEGAQDTDDKSASGTTPSTRYYDDINNSKEGFAGHQIVKTTEAKSFLTAAIEQGYINAAFAFREKFSLSSQELIALARTNINAKKPQVASLYLLAAIAEKKLNFSSDSDSISSGSTGTRTASTKTTVKMADAAVQEGGLVSIFEQHYERWNITIEPQKNRAAVVNVMKVLSEYDRSAPGSLIQTLSELKILAESGCVTAALYWGLFTRSLIGNQEIDLCQQGIGFYQNNSFDAAAACWVAALLQEKRAAAPHLALLFNRYYANNWIDSPGQNQRRIEFLTKSLIDYFCDKNIENAKQSCLRAIENNSLTAAYLWQLFTEKPADELVTLGEEYSKNNNFSAAIACYRAAAKLSGTDIVKERLLYTFYRYDNENPFRTDQTISCSQLTLNALNAVTLESKEELLKQAVQQGSVAGAFYLAKINPKPLDDLLTKPLRLAGEIDFATAGAYWLTAIEQGDTEAAYRLVQHIPAKNRQTTQETNDQIAINCGLARQKEQRFLAAAAYFNGAIKWGSVIAAYHLANLLQDLQKRWQTAINQSNLLQADSLNATYNQIIIINSESEHQHHFTATIDIKSAQQPVADLYTVAQKYNGTNDAMFSEMGDFFVAQNNPDAFEACANKIQDSAKRFQIATQYGQNHWTPGANTLALGHFKKLAAANYLPAIFRLIQVHMLGELGLPISYALASQYVRQLVAYNDANTWYQLGTAFNTGQSGLPYSAELASNFYQKAAGAGHAGAAKELAVREPHAKYGDQLESLGINIQNPHTLHVLAQLYDPEHRYNAKFPAFMFEKNAALAVIYYQLAALVDYNSPHPDACERLVEIYKQGLLGVTKEENKVTRYFDKKATGFKNTKYFEDKKKTYTTQELQASINLGNSETAYILARHYENGKKDFGIKKDPIAALEYYKKAASMNHPLALIMLLERIDYTQQHIEEFAKKMQPGEKEAFEAQYNSAIGLILKDKAALYREQLTTLRDPNSFFFLGYNHDERAVAESNTKSQELANLYYSCATLLGKKESLICDLKTKPALAFADRQKQQQRVAQAQHPQNILALGHVYEHGFSDPQKAVACYQSILKTGIGQAAVDWSPKVNSSSAAGAAQSDAATTEQLQHVYGLAAFKLAHAYELPKPEQKPDNTQALNYYQQAATFNNVDALLRLGKIYACGELGCQIDLSKANSHYLQAFSLLPAARYLSDHAYLMLGLALEYDRFELYKKPNITNFLEATIQKTVINTGLLTEQLGFEKNSGARGAPTVNSPNYLNDMPLLFYKIAAEMGNLEAIILLDKRNNSAYFPSHLKTADDFLHYYQQQYQSADNTNANLAIHLANLFYPNAHIAHLKPEFISAASASSRADVPSCSLHYELQRYARWLQYLGLYPLRIQAFSQGAKKDQIEANSISSYYERALLVDQSSIEAAIWLSAIYLFGQHSVPQDLDIGRINYGKIMELYQLPTLNLFESHFGIMVAPRENTNYHESPLANREGWSEIYNIGSRINAGIETESLSAEELFKIALYYTTLPTYSVSRHTSSQSQARALRSSLTNTPSGASPHTPGSGSHIMRARSATLYATSSLLDASTLTRPSSALLPGSQQTSPALTASMPAALSSTYVTPATTARPSPGSAAFATPASQASSRRSSLSQTGTSNKLWHENLDKLQKQEKTTLYACIDYFYLTVAKKLYYSCNANFCYFPTWEIPPENAEEHAVHFYQLAAPQYPLASIELCKIYYFGLMGKAVNTDLSNTHYNQVFSDSISETPNIGFSGVSQKDFQFNLGRYYESYNNPNISAAEKNLQAFNAYNHAATSNHTDACFRLAEVYTRGELGQSVNPSQANFFYQKAIQLSSTKLPQNGYYLFLYGLTYEEGKFGSAQNKELALNYYKLAAQKDCIEAIDRLFYYHRLSNVELFKWLRYENSSISYLRLGQLYDPYIMLSRPADIEPNIFYALFYYLSAVGAAVLPSHISWGIEMPSPAVIGSGTVVLVKYREAIQAASMLPPIFSLYQNAVKKLLAYPAQANHIPIISSKLATTYSALLALKNELINTLTQLELKLSEIKFIEFLP